MKKEQSKEVHWFERLEADIADTETGKSAITSQEWQQIRQDLGFEKHIIQTYRWVHEMGLAMGISDQPRQAYQALRSTLRALRDRLPPEEVFQFAAQLPQHLRGIFFEQYTIAAKPDKMSAKDFLNRIREEGPSQLTINPKEIFTATLQVLYQHVSEGELDDIYATMPDDIKQLWDEARG